MLLVPVLDGQMGRSDVISCKLLHLGEFSSSYKKACAKHLLLFTVIHRTVVIRLVTVYLTCQIQVIYQTSSSCLLKYIKFLVLEHLPTVFISPAEDRSLSKEGRKIKKR